MRANDGADHAEPRMDIDFIPSQKAGWWRQDPISQVPVALGAHWYKVRPFVMKSATQFRVPPPPAMSTDEYAAAPLQPDSRRDRPTAALDGCSSRGCWRLRMSPWRTPASRSGSPSSTIRCGDPSPRFAKRTRAQGRRARATAIRTRSAIRRSRRSAPLRAISPAQTAHRRSRRIRRATPGSAAPCSRRCVAFTAATTLLSLSSRTNTTASRAAAQAAPGCFALTGGRRERAQPHLSGHSLEL